MTMDEELLRLKGIIQFGQKSFSGSNIALNKKIYEQIALHHLRNGREQSIYGPGLLTNAV